MHHANILEEFLRNYGLVALFFAAAFEGDISLLLAGMMMHQGVWPVPEAIAVGAAGGLAGDTFYFWLGHGTAKRWLTTAHGQKVMPRIERFTARYGIKSLFLGRYIYGARVATMFFWGMRRLAVGRFLLLDGLNCVIWSVAFGGLGYLFGSSLEGWLGRIGFIETRLLIGLLVFMALIYLRYYILEVSRLPGEKLPADPDRKNLTP